MLLLCQDESDSFKKRRVDFLSLGISIVVCFVAPNIFFYLAYDFFGVNRSIINLDYVLCAVFMSFNLRRVFFILFFVFVSVDFLCLVSQVFPFMRMEDLLYLARFLSVSPSVYKVWMLLGVGSVALCFYVVCKVSRHVSALWTLSFLNVSVFYCLIFNFYGANVGESFWVFSGSQFVRSQSLLLFQARSSSFIEDFDSADESLISYEGGAATDNWSDSNNSQRLFLIVNESWGVPNSPSVQEAIIRPLTKRSDLAYEQGVISFVGATVSAELRELCRLQPEHFGFRDEVERLSQCLPHKLKAEGYETFAMHGATSLMYDRKDWYPKAGFNSSVFFENMKINRRCYSFPGACDRDLFPVVSNYFKESGARFFYWMTLNTHASYDPRDIYERLVDCSALGIEADSESCRNIQLQAQFFDGLSKLLTSPEMAGVDVIIVGDHEPRLTNQIEKSKNFVGDKVPWIRIKVAPYASAELDEQVAEKNL